MLRQSRAGRFSTSGEPRWQGRCEEHENRQWDTMCPTSGLSAAYLRFELIDGIRRDQLGSRFCGDGNDHIIQGPHGEVLAKYRHAQ